MSKTWGAAAVVALFAGSTAMAGSGDTIMISNFFDSPKGLTLAQVLATDTLGASAGVNDFGVIVRTVGGLGGNTTIAPSISFATSSAGGANSAPTTLPRNDQVSASGVVTGISVTGNLLSPPPNPAGKLSDGIGMWGDQLVTISLDEVRVAGNYASDQGFIFNSLAGLNDFAGMGGSVKMALLISDASGVLEGYVNGVQVDVANNSGVWTFTGAQPNALTSEGQRVANFNLFVPGEAKYITLVSLSQGDGIAEDKAVWANASITAGDRGDIPAPGTIALAAIGLVAANRRRRA